MSDQIDRQAAIDTVHRAIFDFFDICSDDDESPITYKDEQLLEINKAITIQIRKLPSAEPEIIRCKDCEWFRKEYGWNCIEYKVCGISPTHHPIRKEEDYCSRAERRTDETD